MHTYNANAQENNLKQNQDPVLDSLEEKVFHQSFSNESKEARVSRLENLLFGEQNSQESIEVRINKIKTALKTPDTEQPVIKPELIDKTKPESTEKPSPSQGSGNSEGIIGAINQIEMKMFNMTFNEYPFAARINALEDRLLQKKEILINRKKPLLERVTILVNKTGIPVQKDTKLNLPSNENLNTNSEITNPKNKTPKSYSINPNTGLLIDSQTGEIVKDNDGQPISVMVPQPLPQQVLPQGGTYGYQPLQQNPLYQNNPYGNQFNQNQGIPSPYDFLFNQQNNLNPGGSDPDY